MIIVVISMIQWFIVNITAMKPARLAKPTQILVKSGEQSESASTRLERSKCSIHQSKSPTHHQSGARMAPLWENNGSPGSVYIAAYVSRYPHITHAYGLHKSKHKHVHQAWLHVYAIYQFLSGHWFFCGFDPYPSLISRCCDLHLLIVLMHTDAVSLHDVIA